ncbi:hypothetical protein GTA08_BOTSDO01956 [Neofusicoccum parvum]|uniref:Uncharacterized protein n=1 Tax=Neofusicoccum parvum TaxID=310453 RepID=A0ACB5RWS5_9PEZI|nr:hypothetical protein GTA08_BOTSDO01956 [Neofusicoccum parvum]
MPMAKHHLLNRSDAEDANNAVNDLPDHGSRAAGSTRSSAGVTIPYDIWTRIVTELDFETLKSLRCCSKWFALETSRLLFAKITVDLDKDGIERIVTIAGNKTLARLRNYLAFDDALLSFVNLENVDLDLGWRFITSWHRLSIPYESINQDQPAQVAAAPTAFLLRSLGWRNAFCNGVASLNIHGKVPRWEPQDLESVWDEDRWALPQTEKTTAEVQMQADLMKDAFSRLTALKIDLEVSGLVPPAVRMLAGYLSAARELKRLHLGIQQRAVNPPLFRSPDTLDTFIQFGVTWPRLKALTLSMYFSAASLLCALSSVAPTLESLNLTDCRLVCNSSWPQVYDKMRDVPFGALRQLRFSGNYDCSNNIGQKAPEEKISLKKSVRHFSEGQGPVGSTIEQGYGLGIYDYILRKTDQKPPLYSFNIRYDHDGLG